MLLLDRADAIAKADAAGVFVGAVRPEMLPARPYQAPAPVPHTVVTVGARTPVARDRIDIERGLLAVTRLAPLGTGKGAVVSRAYVLGLEAEEGVRAMLARIGALRQWGLGKRRRAGVLVRRLAASDAAPAPDVVLRDAAAQGLAGVAVTGDAAAVAAYARAGALADQLGLFLVTCAAGEAGGVR